MGNVLDEKTSLLSLTRHLNAEIISNQLLVESLLGISADDFEKYLNKHSLETGSFIVAGMVIHGRY